jgi:hypothetical protein
LQIAFNAHLTQYRVHLSNDPDDLVTASPAIDLPSAIILANTLKANFNTHRAAVVDDSDAPAHFLNDTVNVVSTANAVDLGTLLTLSQAVNIAYNAHRTQLGVHGNSLFINLAPPSQVIYEGAEFFQIVTGIPGLVAPYAETEVTGMMTFFAPGGIPFTNGTIVTAVTGVAQFTDAVDAAFTSTMVGSNLVVTGAAVMANNGVFKIISYTSTTQIGIANAAATSVGETNEGVLSWAVQTIIDLV